MFRLEQEDREKLSAYLADSDDNEKRYPRESRVSQARDASSSRCESNLEAIERKLNGTKRQDSLCLCHLTLVTLANLLLTRTIYTEMLQRHHYKPYVEYDWNGHRFKIDELDCLACEDKRNVIAPGQPTHLNPCRGCPRALKGFFSRILGFQTLPLKFRPRLMPCLAH